MNKRYKIKKNKCSKSIQLKPQQIIKQTQLKWTTYQLLHQILLQWLVICLLAHKMLQKIEKAKTPSANYKVTKQIVLKFCLLGVERNENGQCIFKKMGETRRQKWFYNFWYSIIALEELRWGSFCIFMCMYVAAPQARLHFLFLLL